jgi:predicted NAD/FAD-binding protein
MTTSTRVAIVGSGIAGLGAARALARAGLDVVIYEAAPRAGGHVHTVHADGHAIDMGFIVCNHERYPLFFKLLGELGIRTRPTTMAFSVSLPARDLEWGSAHLSALFAQRRRILDPRHWRFLLNITSFLRRARRDLDLGQISGSLADYLPAGDLRDAFAIPLTAALWSLAPDRCTAFPAETFIRFLDQHGMLRTFRPLAWHTIEGGSQRYVDALLASLPAKLLLSTPVTRITRDASGVTVDGARFDRVVIATHADTALSLLADPSDAERATLGAIRYSTNRTVLHTDRGFLPRSPAAHAAWNYVADPVTSQVAVTYSMTRLQGLPDAPYLVTLNPRREPRGILAEVAFTHPQFDATALTAQAQLPRLANTRRTYYAGAHFGFGFHEDGLRSGLAAAARLLADIAGEMNRVAPSVVDDVDEGLG